MFIHAFKKTNYRVTRGEVKKLIKIEIRVLFYNKKKRMWK